MENNAEKTLDLNVLNDVAGRKIIDDLGDSAWGQLFFPSLQEIPENKKDGLRVVVFGSYLLGYLLLETLKKCEQHNPGRLNICGLVTDDPASPDAKDRKSVV